ncbi:MAG: acyl-ACP--UDP-N-acetylglucosamine O-acyltransferase [Bacteroidaceae bacterium]|nr:acyl-ACP--UDP-N-acetylglucosamine O-acyltransferase [Bacteroidaceae bacterium]
MANNISPQAHIDSSARLGDGVTIYPFTYIEGDVVIGDGCTIYPFASVMAGTRMGKNNVVHQGTVLAALPQDFEFRGDKTELVIGDNNIIRENVVINRATFAGGQTVIGNGNFIMEGVHISHDTKIHDNCVLGYGTKIAGDIEIHDYAILSSNVIANPGVRVGRCAMVQSGCRFSKDVPPYIVAHHNPIEYGGVNSTILTNAGVDEKVQHHIAQAYRLVFNGKTSLFDAINQILDQVPGSKEIDNIIQFLRESEDGIISK